MQNKQQPLKSALEYRCSETCGQSSWKIPMKKFIISKAECLEPATLLELNLSIGILHGFYCEFYQATSIAIFKNCCF